MYNHFLQLNIFSMLGVTSFFDKLDIKGGQKCVIKY